jgi:DNA-directed RNA polymerase specialized sigma24 family protein
LPVAYREVVKRCDLSGQSAGEVAQQLQCSQGAVYMRRLRAHDLLRQWLREDENLQKA